MSDDPNRTPEALARKALQAFHGFTKTTAPDLADLPAKIRAAWCAFAVKAVDASALDAYQVYGEGVDWLDPQGNPMTQIPEPRVQAEDGSWTIVATWYEPWYAAAKCIHELVP